MIVVTDERHQCPDENFCSPSAFTTYLQSIRLSGKARVYGLVGNHNNWGSVFSYQGNVAASSYANTLTTVSQNIKAHLESEFDLQHKPDGAVTVSVKESDSSNFVQRASNEFSVTKVGDKYRLIFDNNVYVPPEDSTIRISYNYLAHEFEDSWTLEFEPLQEEDKLIFTVINSDGTKNILDSTKYTVSGNMISLANPSEVKTLVPQGSRVFIKYRENKPLQRIFSLTDAVSNIILSSVSVIVDGVEQTGGYDFDTETNTLTFDNAPTTEGAVIEISYEYIIGNKLRYTITRNSNTTNIYCLDYTSKIELPLQ